METLELAGAVDNIKQLINQRMKIWKTQLAACSEDLGEVLIRRGIFQRGFLISSIIRDFHVATYYHTR